MNLQFSFLFIFMSYSYNFFCIKLSLSNNLKTHQSSFSQKTPVSDDEGGNVFSLSRHYIECPIGSIISGFQFHREGSNQFNYEFSCRRHTSISKKDFIEKETPMKIVENQGENSLNSLDNH